MESRRRYKRFGAVSLLALVVLVGGLGGLMYREVRQENLNRALFAAIYSDQPETAIQLLDEGADANAQDTGNQPVRLHHVLIDLYNRLRGKKLARQQKGGLSPLLAMLAWRDSHDVLDFHPNIDHKQTDLLTTLLEKGADFHVRDEYGDTALIRASELGYVQCVQRLVDRGAEVSAGNYDGVTPLFKAAMNGHTHVVRILLRFRADPNTKIHEGYSALQTAKFEGHQEIVTLLKQAGAKE